MSLLMSLAKQNWFEHSFTCWYWGHAVCFLLQWPTIITSTHIT